MGQRINIQYSVDVDDLAREAGRLVESAFIEYQTLQAHCALQPTDRVLSYEMAERLDEIRLKLAAIDHRLNDVSNIVLGYLNYKAQEQEASHHHPEGRNSSDPSMENIETTLQNLTDVLEPANHEISD